MVDYTCHKCGTAFRSPSDLRRHHGRKTPCEPILDAKDLPIEIQRDPLINEKRCHFCGRVFSSYSAMRRHIRGTCNIAPNKKNGNAGMELLCEHTIRRQQEQIESQKQQIKELISRQNAMENALRTLTLTNGTASYTNLAGDVAIQGNQNQTDARRININIFGQETLTHATCAKIRTILDDSMRQPALPEAAQAAVLKTALLIFSDPEHPENLTAYLPNKKRTEVLIHGEKGWEMQPLSMVQAPMATKSLDVIFNRQPYENANEYGPLMRELAANEKLYSEGKQLRPVLVKNKELLARVLETLPKTLAGYSYEERDEYL